jgi:hypothetical protein
MQDSNCCRILLFYIKILLNKLHELDIYQIQFVQDLHSLGGLRFRHFRVKIYDKSLYYCVSKDLPVAGLVYRNNVAANALSDYQRVLLQKAPLNKKKFLSPSDYWRIKVCLGFQNW